MSIGISAIDSNNEHIKREIYGIKLHSHIFSAGYSLFLSFFSVLFWPCLTLFPFVSHGFLKEI